MLHTPSPFCPPPPHHFPREAHFNLDRLDRVYRILFIGFVRMDLLLRVDQGRVTHGIRH